MILITAFNAFGGATSNASEEILRSLEHSEDVTRVLLPTEYIASTLQLRSLIDQLRPDALICLGVWADNSALRIELEAKNWDCVNAPDNAGVVRSGHVIAPTGPSSYPTTLPYTEIARSWKTNDIPFVFSDDAGGFVCNHLFYQARHALEVAGSAIPCGFIHVPTITDRRHLDLLLFAIQSCLEITRIHAGRPL